MWGCKFKTSIFVRQNFRIFHQACHQEIPKH
jgi:hypothetical protein